MSQHSLAPDPALSAAHQVDGERLWQRLMEMATIANLFIRRPGSDPDAAAPCEVSVNESFHHDPCEFDPRLAAALVKLATQALTFKER